ncbi:MAG: AAA family ATPase [Calditrichaeota bacterium]|nr:MAG: AAA family ATPase [Calditrichota bacterium]
MDDLLSYYSGANVIIACMALEALTHKKIEKDISETILNNLNDHAYWKRFFALRVLEQVAQPPLVGRVLVRLDKTWEEAIPFQILRDFLQRRKEHGEALSFGEQLKALTPERLVEFLVILDKLGEELNAELMKELKEWDRSHVDVSFLEEVGRLWKTEEDVGSPWIEYPRMMETVQQLENQFTAPNPRSVILVGQPGVGKTTIARALGKRLQENGWTIFEASAVELLAGQVFIGQLEERIKDLIHNLSGERKILWVVPNFHDLSWAGSHRYSPTSILDMIFPYLETHQICVLGETQPQAYERLVQRYPRMRTVVETIQIPPLPPEETLALARLWADNHRLTDGSDIISENTLKEAFNLTQQYLGDKAAPGSLLEFLELTYQRLASNNGGTIKTITLDDLLVTLSQITGLPINILDEREGLDLASLRNFFENRVMGQTEAIDCLVERVAMIKAGLTDPNRPAGVFLFAGPTGTGKTEIAKALAEFLFGSVQRMIRLDMSEFQTPDSLIRIFGDDDPLAQKEALVNQIRKQPFSVILLDEFEKAHPSVWDIFLQVFDDGRLTDRKGNLADFRHSIIIMTSNLGGVIPRGASIGFATGSSGFTSSAVSRAIESTFRKEFINRIDRVVVFQPLTRAVMRNILHKELNEVMQRRGLRNRTWAVEWHDSAIDFLLEKGFTTDLGARPLRRAIEQYLLSPLAITIVNHQFPEGDQFLFIRSNGKAIQVEFIDPDAPDEPVEEALPKADSELNLAEIILDARGSGEEVAFLKNIYGQLQEQIEGKEWEEKKARLLAQMSTPGFWDDPGRYKPLGMAEYMDRIETGFETATRLLDRLQRFEEEGKSYSVTLVKQLAHQLYLLERACEGVQKECPQDVFIQIVAGRESATRRDVNNEFARQIGDMYINWAEKRRMRYKILEQKGGNGTLPFSRIIAISGYGAFNILQPETGVHVLEIPGEGSKSFERCKVHVLVVPQPDEPAANEGDALLNQALETLKSIGEEQTLKIVRRYRENPSPLVRDSVRKWRTGRLERVLGGDFDLITSDKE